MSAYRGGVGVLSMNVRTAVGRRLAVNVRDDHGRVLLARGAPLTGGLCERLAQRGYRTVYVQDGVSDDVLPREAISEKTRTMATTVARESLRRAEQGGEVPVGQVVKAVEAIMLDLAHAEGSALELEALRSVSDYTYVHSVNVCVYALFVGVAAGLPGEHLRALGVGALLHDVGKVFCAELCGKQGKLEPAEWERIRQHPVDGFEILRKHRDLHLFSAHIAYQHHERLDGTGYPRGLTTEKILPVARMVAVADVYDAMTADRPHAGAREPVAAMAELQRGAGRVYDAEYVRTFLRRMAVYPTGTPLLLKDGTLAVVVGQSGDPGVPSVRLLGRAGRRFEGLAQVPAAGDLAVVQVLTRWPPWLEAG